MREVRPRRWRTPALRKIAVAAALTALSAGAAFAVYGVPGVGESDQAKALRVLRTDRAVLDRRLGALDRAPRLIVVRRGGQAARADASRLRAASALDGIKDPAVADPARAAHRAMI